MKKLLFIITLFIMVCFILYNSFVPHMQASNISHEDEYYYNEDANLNEDGTFMSINSLKERTDSMITPEQIDTTKDSITVLVNKEYSLPADYVPPDLVVPDVLFNINYYDEKKLMRQEAATALENLFQAAKDNGLTLYGISGYRSYARQEQIYNTNIRTKGEEYTNRYSAKPGFSEHQTGLVLDVSSASIGNRLEPVFAYTPEGIWLNKNAYRYGFIIRYPKDKENITGYSYEPWHLRYVGEKLAKHLHDNNLTLEEYYGYKPSESVTDYISYDNVVDIDESTDKKELSEPTAEEIEKVSHGQEDETANEETDIMKSDSDKNNPKDGATDKTIAPDSGKQNDAKKNGDSANPTKDTTQTIPNSNEENMGSTTENLDTKSSEGDSSFSNPPPIGSNISIPETYFD